MQADRRWVELLVKHRAFEPVESEWIRWPALAATLGLVGRLDAAEALLVALESNRHVLTGVYSAFCDDPRLYDFLAAA